MDNVNKKHKATLFSLIFMEARNFLDLYDELENKSSDNYLAGYAYFLQEYEQKSSDGESKLNAITHAVEQCKEKGYLMGIVDKEDFIPMYNDSYSYDSQLRYEGKVEGMVEGIAKRDMEIAQKAFDDLNRGKSLSSIIEMLKNLGIPDNIIESAQKQ